MVATPDAAAGALECGAPLGGQFTRSTVFQVNAQMLSQCVHGSGYVGDPPHPFVSTSELLNLQVGSLDSGTAWQTPDSSDVADSAPVAPYRSRPTPLLVVPVSAMSGHPPTVTEALSKIHLKVTAPGPLPPAEDFAPLFRDLDLVWRSTHTQELSTPAFILHLSNYVMIQERVTPSSQEGASIKDTVGSIARVRLGLLVSQGTTYGAELHQAASDQGAEIQTGDRSETQATDRLPPSERLMALNMALETYEHIMRTGAVLSQALADVGNLNPPSSRPGKAPQKSPVWYAELRTTVPGSARFTGVRPAENVAELDMAASHRLQRSAVIHQLLSGMSADGHYCSRGSARPGPCLGPATEVLGRSCPLQVQDGSYAHGPCGTLIATLTCSQGQKSSRSADYNKTHPMPVHLIHLKPILSTGCKLCNCKVKCGNNPAGKRHTSAPPAGHVLDFTLDDSTPSQARFQLVGIQVLSLTNMCASLPSKGYKAGRVPAGLQTDPAHARLYRVQSCMNFLANSHILWLPAHAGDIVSQKLSVAFHTADPVVDSAHTIMPSPSAKLKASRRLPKHLRVSGAPPSGALAEARAEAEARYARGESNQHGQHSCLQGKRRTEEEAENQHTGHANPRRDDWDSRGRQHGWYNSAATGSTDVWQARTAQPAQPAPGWRPRTEARGDTSSNPTDAGPCTTGNRPQIPKETEVDYEPDQEDSNMAELEVEIELPTPKQNPPKSAVTRLVQKRGADHVTAPLTAAGTRSSAPDSSSEELVTAEPDKETGATRANRCQATCSDSEELIPATESRQEDGLWPQQATDTFAFPAPLPGAQGGPEGWNQLPIVHVNKRLLQWWSQPPKAKVNTPSPSAFLRAFFLTRPDANGLSIFDRLKGPEDLLRGIRQIRNNGCGSRLQYP